MASKHMRADVNYASAYGPDRGDVGKRRGQSEIIFRQEAGNKEAIA